MGPLQIRVRLLAALVAVAGLLGAALVAFGPVGSATAGGSCTESWANPISGSWSTAANWSPAVVPGAGDDVCLPVLAAPYAVTLSASGTTTVNSLTVGGASGSGAQLTVRSGAGITPALSITNSSTIEQTGTLELDSVTGGGSVYLAMPAGVTLTDDGLFLDAHDGASADYLRANLDIGAGGTADIAGPLTQDSNTTTTNSGTFTVDATGSLNLSSGGDVFSNGGSVVNGGSLKLSSGASWTQNAGVVVQSGNPVEIFNSGLLDDVSGGGSFWLIDSAQLEGTVPAGQTVTAESVPAHNANVTVDGTVTNRGTLVLDSPTGGGTSFLTAALSGSPEVDNFGSIVAQSESSNPSYLRVKLVNEASGTVEAGAALIQDENTTTANSGTFTVDAAGSLSLTSAGDVFSNGGSVVNGGSLKLSSDASWTQSAGSESGLPVEIFNSGLLDDVSGGGSFWLVDSAQLEGTIPVGQTVTAEAVPAHDANVALVGGTVTNDGMLVLDEPSGGGTSYLSGAATLVNDGQLTSQTENGATTNYLRVNLINSASANVSVASGELLADTDTSTTNDGNLTVAVGAELAASAGNAVVVNNAGSGNALTNHGGIVLSGNASFTQNGKLTGNPVEIFNSGLLDDVSGGGSFWLVDSAQLEGTVPAGQTVTAESVPAHNANVTVDGTVTNRGTLVLDSPTGGGTSFLTAALSGSPEVDNFGSIVAQSESSNPSYLRVKLVNEASGTVEVMSATLIADQNTLVTNDGTFTTDPKSGPSPTPTFAMSSGGDVFSNGGSVVNGGSLKLSSGASWTQNAGVVVQSGNPVEIFNSGLLDDVSGGGSFWLIDSAQLEGTVPAGQTVTAESVPAHNANVTVDGTVTNRGTLVLDSPTGGGTSFLTAALSGSPEVDNFGSIVAQSESSNPSYLRVKLVNEASGTVEAGAALIQDENTTTANSGTFTVDAAGSLSLTSAGDVFSNGGSVVNGGSLKLSSDASWTQSAGSESGLPVEIFNSGLLDDVSGGGSFWLVDSAQLEGTIPVGQTVTAEAVPAHDANVALVGGTVTNDGMLVLDEPSGGGTSYLSGAATLVNDGQLTSQTENGATTNYLRVNLTNSASGALLVDGGTLLADSNTTTLNHGLVEIVAGAKLNLSTGGDVFANEADGTMQSDIASLASFGTVNLAGGGTFTPGGRLSADLIGGYAPAPGTEFNVITGTNGGTFASVANGFWIDYSQPHIIAVRVLATSSTTLGAVPGASTFGQQVTLTATIAPGPGGIGNPTGQVTFLDGAASLGSAPVSTAFGATTATLQTSLSPAMLVGTHHLTASYSGDPDYVTSVSSPAISEVVNQAVPAVVVVASSPTTIYGSPVTLTATITGPVGVTPDPTGTLTFTSGMTVLGDPSLTTIDGMTTASLSTSTLPGGSDQISASYGGDSNYASAAASTPATVNVSPAIILQPSSTTVNPSAPATFTATADGASSVQWQVSTDGGHTWSNDTTDPGNTTTTLTIPDPSVAESGNEYRAVFTSSAGTATSNPVTLTVSGGATPGSSAPTQTTPTHTGASPVAPPVLTSTVDAAPSSGQVLVKLPGANKFVPLSSLQSIPIGATIDATHGSVTITAATPGGGTETAIFSGGEFILRQSRDGQFTAVLTGGNFAVCKAPKPGRRSHALLREGRTAAIGSLHPFASATAAAKKPPTNHKVVRHLWSNVKGNFSTQGAYGSAAVTGTEWLTADRCDGTYFRVTRHEIIVTSFKLHNHKTKLKQGHSYLAPAHR